MRDTLWTISFVGTLILGYYGFRFVTQAGQGLDVIQNDGYGGTGGVMILASGFLMGILLMMARDKK